ncbi:hypothetical protein EIP91_010271 [Steccherinum ochraceum]|uniref:F-box domain-containing protein n=1 Tax=Steccherinum ochraceum TaxID=92696 RepID=A0A4R0RLZ9_9APHY|nr:hypothetical protein EIP91_010271 [Steccherinum ochraceum]
MSSTEEMSRARLPQELIDTVIGLFCDDKTTLHELALLSSACLATARSHLFRSCVVHAIGYTLLQDRLSVAQRSIVPGPSVGTYIRHLKLSQLDNQLYTNTLLDLIGNMTRLQSLSIAASTIFESPFPSILPHPNPTSLDTLHISWCTVKGATALPLLHLLSAFTSISELHMVRTLMPDLDRAALIASPAWPSTYLRCLYVEDNCLFAEDLMVALGKVVDLANTPDVKLEWRNLPSFTNTCNTVLGAMNTEALRYLEITFPHISEIIELDGIPTPQHPLNPLLIDLSSCTRLESICIKLNDQFEELVDSEPFWKLMFTHLSSLPPSSHVSTVRVEVRKHHSVAEEETFMADLVELRCWSSLGNFLRRLPYLVEVEVVVFVVGSGADAVTPMVVMPFAQTILTDALALPSSCRVQLVSGQPC